MHGLYTLKTLDSDCSAPLYLKILGTFSAFVAILCILTIGGFALVMHDRLDPASYRQALLAFTICLAMYSAAAVALLAALGSTSLKPLSTVIQWAKEAESLEAVSCPENASQEIVDIHQILNATLERLGRIQREVLVGEKQKALFQLATQVAHDIRSPLAALRVASDEISSLPEEKRLLLRSAVARICDIANHLVDSQRLQELTRSETSLLALEEPNRLLMAPPVIDLPSSGKLAVELISSLVDTLVTEKRLQYRGQLGLQIEARLDADSYGLFARVNPMELKRVLSNLINNSVEACPETGGRIQVLLSAGAGELFLRVRDNGRGIPPEILPRLMRVGETFGKPGGTGLGLAHAKQTILAWNGSIHLESTLGKGTEVRLTLPSTEAPSWFFSSLNLSEHAAVGVLDDDPSIHQVWEWRFESQNLKNRGISLFHFSRPEELRRWARSEGRRPLFFLVDQELLKNEISGIEVIRELGIAERSVLVTSHYEAAKVREACRELQVKLLPKNMAGYVPIFVSPAEAYS